MRAYALLNIDKERLQPFFDRVPELFHTHHHSEAQDPEGYEEPVSYTHLTLPTKA